MSLVNKGGFLNIFGKRKKKPLDERLKEFVEKPKSKEEKLEEIKKEIEYESPSSSLSLLSLLFTGGIVLVVVVVALSIGQQILSDVSDQTKFDTPVSNVSNSLGELSSSISNFLPVFGLVIGGGVVIALLTSFMRFRI